MLAATVTKYEQDNDSTVGGSGVTDYEVAYEYTKNAGDGRNTVRKTKQTLPGGERVDYQYLTSSNRLDGYLSRVTRIRDIGPVSVPPAVAFTIVEYKYNGEGEVVGTEYAENSVKRERFSSTSGVYPAFDNFNRIKKDTWVKDLAADRAIYDCDLVYDRNSNIVRIDDHVHKTKFDAVYSMDDRDRLIDGQEGDLNGGSSISTESRQQTWTLTQTGNWELEKLDLNGDGDWSDTDEHQDDRTHNAVNELLDRDTDDNGTPNYTLSYDEAGNLIDDGEDYKYEYDAFYRLRKIKERVSPYDLVAEYRYNGLGFRIAEHADTDTDGDVDGSDAWHHFAHDERWRVVAMFINSSTDPEEQYVHHTAGADGFGGSSYIDELVFRDRDAVTDINNTLDERLYYLQNRHFDVVALVDDNGKQVEMVRYSAYGVPFGLPGGDCDSDGDCDYGDTTDTDQIQTWINGSVYDVRGDMDLDGDVDAGDKTIAGGTPHGNSALGLNELSAVSNSSGWICGQLILSPSFYHFRRRVAAVGLGNWVHRDPIGYYDGVSLYGLLRQSPIVLVDSEGLSSGNADCPPWPDILPPSESDPPGRKRWRLKDRNSCEQAGRTCGGIISADNTECENSFLEYGASDTGSKSGFCGETTNDPCHFAFTLQVDIEAADGSDDGVGSAFYNYWHGPNNERQIDWDADGCKAQIVVGDGGHSSIARVEFDCNVACGRSEPIMISVVSLPPKWWASKKGSSDWPTASMSIDLKCGYCPVRCIFGLY